MCIGRDYEVSKNGPSWIRRNWGPIVFLSVIATAMAISLALGWHFRWRG